MSVLDAARRLAAIPVPPDIGERCWFCEGSECSEHWVFDHEPACPWLQMPAIVRALEAAERLVAESPYYDSAICVICETNGIYGHDPDCLWSAFVDALSGAAGPRRDTQ